MLRLETSPRWHALALARQLLAAARFGVAIALVGLKGLEAEDPAPTAITVALERVEHEHRAVVAYGPDTVSHGSYRI